ncbi:MAG: lamin tail domain-containing protein [Bacteroidetes bacterium]|nr:lamin tail domain-containing protein [Bacteroidota bacterium]
MKRFTLVALPLLVFLFIALHGTGHAQVVLYEDFNYTPPANIGGNGNAGSTNNNWTTHSVTSGQTTTIDVVSGNLSYTGLFPPNGYKVSMFGNGNLTSRDINRAFTYSGGNVLYFSVLLNVVDNSGITTTGDYFMHFGATSGTAVTIFGGRLGVKSVNSGANYRFMIQNTSSGTPTFTEFAMDCSFGTTYLVVVKYNKGTSPTTASLWVNPTSLGGAEPSGSVSNSSGTGTFATFASICLRNNATTPKAEVDEIRVGPTWADVTPPGVLINVTTSAVTGITTTTAVGGGNVISDGGSPILARGICWSTSANPTITGNHTTEPGTIGVFTSNMTGLSANTFYHVRAYATNALGTGYGGDVGFSTLCQPNPPVSDFAANNTSIMVGQSVNFSDSTRFCPTTWNWSFIGGTPNTSNLQNPTGILYSYAGTFNVCLTTTNAYGTNILCKNDYITVNGPLNSKFVITEIMYNPPESGTDSLEFIELYNNDTATVNLQGFSFSNPFSFTFPNFQVGPQAYVLVAKSASAMYHTFGVTALQWASGSLSNSGTLIKLKDRFNATVDSVQYGIVAPWDSLANGRGPSLELCDPNSNNSLPANWRHSVKYAAVNFAGDTIWASPGAGCSYPPDADFTASATHIHLNDFVQFTDSSAGQVDAWSWTFEGGTPASSNLLIPPPVQYKTFGTFDVSLTASNVAGQNTTLKTNYIEVGTTGTSALDQKNAFVLYPNPSSGKFSVIFHEKGNYEIKIISCLGNIIGQKRSSEETVVFDLAGLSRGIYAVQVYDEVTGRTVSKKLIIQ